MSEADTKELVAAPEKAVSRVEKRRRTASELCESIAIKSLKYAHGLHEPKELPNGQPNPKYNPDAEKPWVEASTRTRFSIEVYKQHMAARREQAQTERVLGVLVLRERLKDDAWEQHAAQVDKDLKVIDVAVETAK